MPSRVHRWVLSVSLPVMAGLFCVVAMGVSVAGTVARPLWVDAFLNVKDAEEFQRAFPVEWDWMRQDCGAGVLPHADRIGREVVDAVIHELSGSNKQMSSGFESLLQQNVPAGDVRWLELYAHACEARRAMRLAALAESAPRIVFTKRRTVRPSFFAYTEGQSDAQAGTCWKTNAE
jgi:hypothetical protein